MNIAEESSFKLKQRKGEIGIMNPGLGSIMDGWKIGEPVLISIKGTLKPKRII